MLPGCSWGEAQPDGFESAKVVAIQGREGSAAPARYGCDHAVDERPSTSTRLIEELGCGLGVLFAVRNAIRHDPRCQLTTSDIERATQELGPRDGAHRKPAAILQPHPKQLVGIGAGNQRPNQEARIEMNGGNAHRLGPDRGEALPAHARFPLRGFAFRQRELALELVERRQLHVPTCGIQTRQVVDCQP